MLVVVVLVVVRGMLVVGMMDGAGVMGGRTGHSKARRRRSTSAHRG